MEKQVVSCHDIFLWKAKRYQMWIEAEYPVRLRHVVELFVNTYADVDGDNAPDENSLSNYRRVSYTMRKAPSP